jgi:hypothetical protein
VKESRSFAGQGLTIHANEDQGRNTGRHICTCQQKSGNFFKRGKNSICIIKAGLKADTPQNYDTIREIMSIFKKKSLKFRPQTMYIHQTQDNTTYVKD